MARLKPRLRLAQRLLARRWRIVLHVEEADLIPDRLPRRGVALAGPHGAPKWLALDCPCGTGHRLLVNLDSSRRPAWRLVGTRPLTIRPSLDITRDGVRCHFIITGGKVRWAESGHQATDDIPARRVQKARGYDRQQRW
jgi:hypothetical protein